MTITDRLLQHHNHPAKLLLDAGAAAAASALLWQQHLIRGAAVAVAGTTVASAIVFAFADTTRARGMTVGRLATRIAGALVVLGGAWFTSPSICVAGVIVLLLSLVTRATIETFSRALVHRGTSLSRCGTSLYGLSDSFVQLVAIALLAFALVDVLVLYFAGHDITAYLTENSDLLYLPTLFVDITSKGGRLADWYLTPAPYFFPDYVVYFIAHLLGPSIYTRIAIFAVAQALVTFAAIWFLARSVSKSSSAILDAALITVALLWLGVNAGEPFVILFASASHFGAFICSVVLAALWIDCSTNAGVGHAMKARPTQVIALAALGFVATLSDGLFAVEAIVPFAAAAAFADLQVRTPRARRDVWIARVAVWLLLAAIIPAAVYRVPIAPPNINVNWAPSVSDAQRAELEATYHLSDGDFRGGRLWTYLAHDTTRDNIAALVRDPRVEDTEHVDRQRFTVDGASGPLARAISTLPIGLAASALVMLGLLLVIRQRAKAIAMVALVPISGVAGAWFYNVIVPRHTRYPLSVGFEKVYNNSADLYSLVYRTATGTPVFGVVLVAYVACVIALLAPSHLRTLGRTAAPSHDRTLAPLSWLALFSLCSLCATATIVTLLTDLPVMPRYVIPVFAWPIVVTVLFLTSGPEGPPLQGHATLGTNRTRRGGPLGPLAVIAIATGALTYQAYQLAHRSGVTTAFYPPAIACLDAAVEPEGLHNGIAQYWDAKYLQDFSRQDLRIGQYLENLEQMPWITSAKYFRDTYDFAVVDENAEPTYKISIDALTSINGAPRQMVRCGSRSIYIWGKDRLRVTAAGRPAPAAPQPR